MAKLTAIGESPNNDGAFTIAMSRPWTVEVALEGTSALLFHRWSCEDVAEKAAAAKGSTATKRDNIEAYVYRNEKGHICLPGEYVRQAVIHAAKYRRDPRSARKTAFDLYKAGVIALTELAPMLLPDKWLPAKDWNYIDRRRVVIRMAGVTRERPAFLPGWRAHFELGCLTPEYITPADLHDALSTAGRLIGVADNRPTYGRFMVTKFEVLPS